MFQDFIPQSIGELFKEFKNDDLFKQELCENPKKAIRDFLDISICNGCMETAFELTLTNLIRKKMYVIDKADNKRYKAYNKRLKDFAHLINRYHFKNNCFILTASCLFVPLGAIVIEINEPYIDILSLMVHKQYRRNGIATDLIKFILNKMFIGKQVAFRYWQQVWPPSIDDKIEHILAGLHFSLPQRHKIYVENMVTDESLSMHPELKYLNLPASYQYFPWQKLTNMEKNKLRNRVPKNISPFNAEHLIEPLNSFGLRHKEELIGWMVTHRHGPKKIHYASFFIDEKYRGTLVAFCLWYHSFIKHYKHRKEIPYSSYAILEENIFQTRYFNKFFLKFAKVIKEQKISHFPLYFNKRTVKSSD